MPSTRRTVLALLGSGLAGLAGCAGQPRERAVTAPEESPHSSPATPPTPEPTPEPTDTEAPTPNHEALQWWAKVGENGTITPAVADGTVYVGGAGSVWTGSGTPPGSPYRLVALDLVDGSERWSLETGPPVDSTPIVHDGTVYAISGVDFGLGGRNYRLDAVDVASGTRQWQFDPDDVAYLNLLAIAGGSVVLGSNDDELTPDSHESVYALDAESGQQQWQTQYGDVLYGRSAGPFVALPTRDGLYGVDARTGEELWRFESDDLRPPTVLDDTVLVNAGSLTALDVATGDVIWRLDGGGGLGGWDTSSHGIFGGVGDGMVASIDPDDGTERWRTGFPGTVQIVSAWRDRVVVADRIGTIVGFDGTTGAARWQHESSEISDVNEIVVDGDRVFVTYDERTAMASLDAENGTVQWHFSPGGELTEPVRAAETVLIGSTNGSLYALGL